MGKKKSLLSYSDTVTAKYLVHLIACALSEKKPEEKPSNVSFEELYSLACQNSVDGISAAAGLTLYYSNEASLARKMVESAAKTIVVADSSKIGREVFARITDAKKTDVLITNSSDKDKELATLRKLGVKIYEA